MTPITEESEGVGGSSQTLDEAKEAHSKLMRISMSVLAIGGAYILSR